MPMPGTRTQSSSQNAPDYAYQCNNSCSAVSISSEMGKNNAVLVRGARQLITLRGSTGPRRGAALRELGIIQDGAVLIEDGAIVTLGPSRRVENLSAAREALEIDA